LRVAGVAVAEAAYGVRPTQERLARADRLVVVSSGSWFAMGVLSALVLLVQRLVASRFVGAAFHASGGFENHTSMR
jgi:hypothetical protein